MTKRRISNMLAVIMMVAVAFGHAPPALAQTSADQTAIAQPGSSRFSSHTTHISLRDFLKRHPSKILLIGDGTSTSHCRLLLVDKKTGGTTSAELASVCASRKSLKPPPTLEDAQKYGVEYHPGKTDPRVAATIAAGNQLNQQGAYATLAIPIERRQGTITQLAIWMNLAGKNPSAKDAVTPQSIKSDLLTRSKVDPSSLTPQEDSKLNDRVQDIFNAADLTCKNSTTIPVTQRPDEPSTGTDGGGSTLTGGGGDRHDGGTLTDGGGDRHDGSTLIDGGGTSTGTVDIPSGTTFICDNPEYQDITTVSDGGGTTTDGSTTTGDGPHTTDGSTTTGDGPHTTDGSTTTGDGPHTTDGSTTTGDGPHTTGGSTTTGDGPHTTDGSTTTGGGTPHYHTTSKSSIVYGIALFRDPKWIPENPSDTHATATIYQKDESGKWVPSTTPAVITFNFVKRSKEKGECLNRGDKTNPDLFFPAEDNTDLNCTNAEGAAKYFGTATTKQPVLSQWVNIHCEDWGAFSVLEATAPGCVPLKEPIIELENGSAVVGPVSPAAAQKTIPRDDASPQNQIADAYEEKIGRHPPNTEDEDKTPVGNGFVGDGLSAYEEYRGFRTMGEHVRTDWDHKDLFIEDSDGIGFGKYPLVSQVTCWPIKSHEYDSERVVNFNKGNANVCTQHGLKLMYSDDMDDGIAGYCHGFGPPKNVDYVSIKSGDLTKESLQPKLDSKGRTVYVGKVQQFVKVVRRLENYADGVITHELGHATGIRHHGDPFWDSIYHMFMGPTISSELNPLVYTIDSFRLCDCVLPMTFPVGKKGNRMSGDDECYMRYVNEKNTVYPLGGRDYECIKNDPGTTTRFCTSKTGTGINAGGHMAGDAAVGNCAGQIVVNDNYSN